jgi:Lrp/AsnC family leucine-responsive transcriptional regulator
MDKIDRDILRHLTIDGRISFRELGDAVHLSPNAVAERYRRLRESGAIRHIRAALDPAVFGRTLQAQIEVKLASGTAAAEFEVHLRHLPQVLSASLMTGSFDYAVRVACTGQDELVQVTEALRERGGVRETYTRVILRELSIN